MSPALLAAGAQGDALLAASSTGEQVAFWVLAPIAALAALAMVLSRNAVHAAMAGNTEMLIGRWHGRFVHVPMALATRMRKEVDPTEDLWMSVVEATGQPRAWF